MARKKQASKKKVVEKKVEEEEEVNYAATADAFFEKMSDEEESEDEYDHRADYDEEDEDANDDEHVSSDDHEDDSIQEEENSDSIEDRDNEEDDDQQESDEEDDAPEEKVAIKPPVSAMGESCTFDLRNLLAMNTHQIDATSLYTKKKKQSSEEKVTIPATEALDVVVNEKYLLEKATDGCTQLISAIWQLPVERSDAGPKVTLPSFDESRIPRALPPPPPKQETKWEKFAKARGIPLNKNKRSRKVWDEATGTWMYRHGYEKANDDSKEWPIMEIKDNEDPYEDPWERQREAKRSRVEKNMESRLRNQERAGALTKGTANKVLKSREKARIAGKVGGHLDREDVPPTGVPVDLKPVKGSEDTKSMKRGKASTLAALAATQRSTASLGNFDKVLEGEPERKKALKSSKKRKADTSLDRKAISAESERNLKMLKAVVEGGGAEKEKAKRKGKLAKGETAYDYEFDDGLGASSFRKKKGRAGAGKMRKMTKKRAK